MQTPYWSLLFQFSLGLRELEKTETHADASFLIWQSDLPRLPYTATEKRVQGSCRFQFTKNIRFSRALPSALSRSQPHHVVIECTKIRTACNSHCSSFHSILTFPFLSVTPSTPTNIATVPFLRSFHHFAMASRLLQPPHAATPIALDTLKDRKGAN